MPDQHIAHRVRQRGARNDEHDHADGNFVDVEHWGHTSQRPDHAPGEEAHQHLKERRVAEHMLHPLLQKADHCADQRGKQAIVPGASKKEREAQRRHDASEIQCRGFRLFLVDFLELRAKLRRAHGLSADFPAEGVQPLELYKIKRRRLPDAARLRQLHAVFKQDRQYNIGRDRKDVDLLRAIGSSEPRHGVLHAVNFRAAKKQHLPHVQ